MDKYAGIIKDSAAYGLMDAHAHATLVCGADSLAAEYTARLFIESVTGKLNSVDIIELPAGPKVLVSDIDFLTAGALLTPVELRQKYYIVKNGETMNESAAAKLLKTLEEPPPSVRIYILCRDERAVLPTIRSRCRLVRLAPLPDDMLNGVIERYYAGSPNAYVARELHLGSIERLEKAVAGGYDEPLAIAYDALTFMKKSDRIVQYAQRMAQKKDALPDIIDMFELVLHDAMMLNLGGEITLKHRRADTAAVAAFYSPATVIRLNEVFDRARRRLKLFGNTLSVTDEFLFSLLEIRQKTQRVN